MTLKKQKTGHSGPFSLGAPHAPPSVAVMQQVNAGREKCKTNVKHINDTMYRMCICF